MKTYFDIAKKNHPMPKTMVTFSKAYLEGKVVLLIRFKYNFELKEYLKKFEGVRWSTTLRSFCITFSKDITNKLFLYLRARDVVVDYSELKAQIDASENRRPKKKIIHLGNNIAPTLEEELGLFKAWMQQKRYSTNTIKTYECMLLIFFRYHYPKNSLAIGQEEILNFNTNYIMANGYSYTYQNQTINALKLFFQQQGNGAILPEEFERPKKARKLPQVLSIDEVKSILYNTPNLKHKTLLSLLYSCGLRIGEALKLEVRDIDTARNFLHVKSAKGAKDRYVPIPRQMIRLLKTYYDSYQPNRFVFEGQNGGRYSAVSARQVLRRSLYKTGIQKYITLHTLRHSHATHLLENGTDLRFIQELLGHNSPKTTMIYTHVSTTSLDKIKNPFDDFEL